MSSIDRYGRFVEGADGACFELLNEPPRKWRNIHYNQVGDHEFYAEVSNIGDGPCREMSGDGTTVNIVGWDCKYLYVRDDETNQCFSPWGSPTPTDVTDRVCRFSAASTDITGTAADLKVHYRFFVPRSEALEAWTVHVTNLTDRPRTVSLFAYAMFQLTGNDGQGNGVWKDNFSNVHAEIGGVLVTNRHPSVPTDRFKGYLLALEGFRAGNGYRDQFTRSEFALGTPKVLWGWNCDNSGGYGPDCAGVVQVTLSLAPRATGRADLLLGACSGLDEVKSIRSRLSPRRLDELHDEQARIERDRAEAFRIDTGEQNRNRDALINIFVKKQMYSYLLDKSGVRDNLQTDCGLVLCDAATARANLLRVLGAQYPDGRCLHSWRPPNRTQYSDKPAWILQTVPWLLKETGDLSLLEQTVGFFESDERATVWEHVKRAYRFLSRDLGAHGLCDQHHADWNDGLEPSEQTGARESVMVSQQLCFGLREVAELADLIGDVAVAAECRELYESMKRTINEVAWDGRWYVRTICQDGYRLGSHRHEEARIFMNTQSWAILSVVADAERARLCMEAVDELIRKDCGYAIADPALTKFDPRIGKFSTVMPYHAENGGCYNHAAGFKGVADCMMGRADQAWETFVKVAPDNPLNPVSQSQAEPFAFVNMYERVPQVYGLSGYAWRTGTAAWFAMLIVEWILGARRSHRGLMIDPCLTRTIPRARIRRRFRGAVYDVSLDNTAGRCTGVRRITVDGKPIEGNVLPVFTGGEHAVSAVI